MNNIRCWKILRTKNNYLLRTSLAFIGVLLMAACRTVGGAYVDSRETAPLRVPEHLDRPSIESALTIPGIATPELAGLRDDAVPPKVLTSEEAALSTSRVGFGQGALFLLVEDQLDSVYRRLGFTLNRNGMSVEEIKPDAHSYVFSYTQAPLAKTEKGFWRSVLFWQGGSGTNYSGRYEVRLATDDNDSDHTRIYLYDADGKAALPESVEQLFGIVQERLG